MYLPNAYGLLYTCYFQTLRATTSDDLSKIFTGDSEFALHFQTDLTPEELHIIRTNRDKKEAEEAELQSKLDIEENAKKVIDNEVREAEYADDERIREEHRISIVDKQRSYNINKLAFVNGELTKLSMEASNSITVRRNSRNSGPSEARLKYLQDVKAQCELVVAMPMWIQQLIPSLQQQWLDGGIADQSPFPVALGDIVCCLFIVFFKRINMLEF